MKYMTVKLEFGTHTVSNEHNYKIPDIQSF